MIITKALSYAISISEDYEKSLRAIKNPFAQIIDIVIVFFPDQTLLY